MSAMGEQPAVTAEAHPAPARDQVPLAMLFIGLAAAPLVWSIHLLANYAISSEACYPGAAPRLGAPPGAGKIWFTLLAIDWAAIIVSALAGYLAYRSWRMSRRESSASAAQGTRHSELVEIGEGRTRFLALWGTLISVLFLLAILFDVVGLFTVPFCG
jgi:hypothetical protein